ncbi:MAG: urease accessory protein UreF [Hyphomicrobiales bacterium]
MTIMPITTTIIITDIPVTEAASLYRLLAWMSPGYPVGAYTYSHGLEQAVEAGYIADAPSAGSWIADILEHGSGFADAVFLAGAWQAAEAGDKRDLADVAELAAAFVATRELALESHAQGRAFAEITGKAWPEGKLALLDGLKGPCAYPVAVGVAAAAHGIPLEDTAAAYLHGLAANLVSAAVRLVPLGQTDGQRILASVEGTVARTAQRALDAGTEEAAGATLMIDICSMKHETQHTRLFRS